MRRSTLLVSPLILTVCVVQSLAAQGGPTLQRQARVRVTTPSISKTPLVGIVDSVDAGGLVLRTGRVASTTIPFSRVTRLEVSRGRKRPMWSKTAPLWLTGAAGGVGAIIGYATSSDEDFFGRDFGTVLLGGLGSVLGLVVGTGIAIGVKTDTWETVPGGVADSRPLTTPSLHMAPGRGARSLTVGLHAAF